MMSLARSSSSLVATALLALVSLPLASVAHICLYEPHQRGAMVLDNPGDDSCTHKGPAPCGIGSAPPGQPVASYPAGSIQTVFFQQSLNHFYGKSPGNLHLEIAKGPNPEESDFDFAFGEIVPDWNAMDEISFSNVSVTGFMPDYACDHCVLRLTYRSQNPGENDTSMNFYQCADIAITADDSKLVPHSAAWSEKKSANKADGPAGCCTVPQWEASFLVAGGVPPAGPGFFSYDATNRYIVSSQVTDITEGHNSELHFQNFSSGIEWRLVQTGTDSVCTPYGLDEWNDFCYGASQNEEWVSNINLAGQEVSVFQNELADFSWGVSQTDAVSGSSQCIPVFRQHGLGNVLEMMYNYTIGIANPQIQVPPSICHMSHGWEQSQSANIDTVRAFAATLPRSPRAIHPAAGLKAHGSRSSQSSRTHHNANHYSRHQTKSQHKLNQHHQKKQQHHTRKNSKHHDSKKHDNKPQKDAKKKNHGKSKHNQKDGQ